MSALRPRLDFTVVIGGTVHQFHNTLRDALETKKRFPALDSEDQIIIITRMCWVAAQRLGITELEFEEFVDAIEDFEFGEPPPLTAG